MGNRGGGFCTGRRENILWGIKEGIGDAKEVIASSLGLESIRFCVERNDSRVTFNRGQIIKYL